tara:strand:- start:859 stop:1170 length:312 start_codon:yes stop_codon:yes gene_type:complete
MKKEEEADALKKLAQMELDLKAKCDKYDADLIDLADREKALENKEKAFEKKFKTLDNSESFGEMVTLVDRIYTVYVSSRNTDDGLYEAIKLLLDARSRFNTQK